MKKLLILPAICFALPVMAQQLITGSVLDETTRLPVKGITVAIQNTKTATTTDQSGKFSLSTNENNISLVILGKGYEEKVLSLELPLSEPLRIYLSEKVAQIDEVLLTTGYQKIPKERSTGSFSSVGKTALNTQVSTNILDRLAATANGIVISRGTSQETPQIMVRGLSTIQGPKAPLIVVDNFPYEGDISNLNPNIVENITILKDAAAASIWGARAANGVIVITTKGAKYNQPIMVDFNTFLTTSPKPDLNYLKVISSADFIDVEQELFKKNFYNTDINSSSHPVLSPVVDLLKKEKKGLLSHEAVQREIERLKGIDSRDQFKRYMYQPLENRQYSLSMTGGAPQFSWTSSLGYDDNTGNLGENYQCMNLRFQNNWQPFKNLTLNTGIFFTHSATRNGRSAYGSIIMKTNAVPYMEMADAAKLPDYIRVGNGDDVMEKYIFLTTSHDGTGSITAAFTPIRIVCQNTLNASLRNMSNVVRIRHTSGAKQRLEDAHKVMGLANKMSKKLEGIFNQWAKVKVNDAEVKKLIQLALCPNKETLQHL